MQIGLVGLGRMGMNMARRWLHGGHEVVAFNRTQEKVREIASEGATPSASLAEFAEKLVPPRIAWLMLPAGGAVDEHVEALATLLAAGDLLVDGGNTYYKDDVRRTQRLAPTGIRYLDAGVSGGIWGLRNGYCTMIGGERADFERLAPLLETLAPRDGYLYCGPAGSGHFVKMVHNGIEYAMMQAYGEGFELLKASPFAAQLDLHDIARLWNRGSVVRSWLLELLEEALAKDPALAHIKGYVEDSGEGRWTVEQAIESGVPATAFAHALFERFRSRQTDAFADKVLAALRNEFGGHEVKKA
jgi:6-phosphogluconate dehydrogenase